MHGAAVTRAVTPFGDEPRKWGLAPFVLGGVRWPVTAGNSTDEQTNHGAEMNIDTLPSPSVASTYEQALELALRIDDLIATARRGASGDADGARLAQALTGNLIASTSSKVCAANVPRSESRRRCWRAPATTRRIPRSAVGTAPLITRRVLLRLGR